MNLNIVRLGPLTKELKRIGDLLERIADGYEMDLADRNLYTRPPQADTSGDAPETLYVDDEREAIREMLDSRGLLTPEREKLLDQE